MRGTLLLSAVLLGLPLAVPAHAQTPDQNLQRAQMALQQHEQYSALAALDRAEADFLELQTPQSRSDQPGESPVVREIGRAREATRLGQWSQASEYVAMALQNSGKRGDNFEAGRSGSPVVGTQNTPSQ
jgi:hypothetical protein